MPPRRVCMKNHGAPTQNDALSAHISLDVRLLVVHILRIQKHPWPFLIQDFLVVLAWFVDTISQGLLPLDPLLLRLLRLVKLFLFVKCDDKKISEALFSKKVLNDSRIYIYIYISIYIYIYIQYMYIYIHVYDYIYLEPETTSLKWMFGDKDISYVKNWNRAIETTVYQWLFGVPGICMYII